SFLVQMTLTLVIVSLVVGYLRPHLKKVLTELCGTEERAQFWTAFSNILLIGLPLIFALNYRPAYRDLMDPFFDIAGKLSSNLGGLLLSLVCIGIIVSFFAFAAPKPAKTESTK
ncbi:MAG TPA: hypothetical protein VLA72_17445, partial [Anaerolineales bacterium]|nr:hypothetical protein [Anaerolineales bacterium]